MVSIITFTLVKILPGDPALLAMGTEATAEEVAAFHEKYNLDKPLLTQYFIWINGVLHGDLGDSIKFSRPVTDCIFERLPRTISIGLPALVIASVLGILFGIISAVRRGKLIDNIITLLSTIGLGAPQFWLGILAIYVFGLKLDLLPLSGYVAPSENFGQYIYYAILPVSILAFSLLASVARQTRSNMLEVINQDYIRTARANGLSKPRVTLKHALKNALIPIITVVGSQIGTSLGGSVVTETVFAWPGVGRLIVDSINRKDRPMVMGCLIMTTILISLVTLAVDIIYAYVDPRIKSSYKKKA